MVFPHVCLSDRITFPGTGGTGNCRSIAMWVLGIKSESLERGTSIHCSATSVGPEKSKGQVNQNDA